MSLTPVSDEVQISATVPTAGAALAAVREDTALVAWEQEGEIRGQLMTVTGEQRSDVLTIGASESGEVLSPAIANVHLGRAFVVYLERPTEAAGTSGSSVERGELRGQLVDETGATHGPPVLIAENARLGQFRRPSIDSTLSSQVNLAWIGDHPEDSARTAPLVRQVGFDGIPPERVTLVGDPFLATAGQGGDVVAPQVVTQRDPQFGGLLVTWFAGATGFEDAAFRGQIFNVQADGSLAPAGEIELHDRVGRAKDIAITNTQGGRYVAAWKEEFGGITGAILNADGSRADLIVIAGEFGEEPALAGLSFDGFIAAWVSNDEQDVGIQAFSGDGSEIGNARRANETRLGSRADPVLAAFPGGRFMVAWANFGIPSRTGAPSPSIRVRGFEVAT